MTLKIKIHRHCKMVQKPNILPYIGVFVFIAAVFAVLAFFKQSGKPQISTIHVINLDRDVERWNSIESQGRGLGLQIQRFSAVYGKDIPYADMRKHGVGNAMVRADRHDHKGEKLHNLGVVGCFLSHRALLAHVHTLNVPDSHGHLILEDDVRLPSDFLQPNGRWDTLRQRIPGDWDIVWLRMWRPHGTKVAEGIMKLDTNANIRCNLGTFSYVVRHGAIPKILRELQFMMDAYDEQMNLQFAKWNCYLLEPGIIEIDSDLQNKSSINAINTGK